MHVHEYITYYIYICVCGYKSVYIVIYICVYMGERLINTLFCSLQITMGWGSHPVDASLDTENVIPWHVKTDVQRVALQEADSRTLMSVAEVRFKAFQSNVPDLGILGHVVEPMKVVKDWIYKCVQNVQSERFFPNQ